MRVHVDFQHRSDFGSEDKENVIRSEATPLVRGRRRVK
jgi:hypothetical protein